MSKTRRNPKSPILRALRRACVDEGRAVRFLEKHRWAGETCCPRCGSVDVYKMKDARTGKRNKDFRWRCRDCKRMFTVRTGTVFEETRLPLRHWCYAFWKACSSKKGVSALQISRECEISYKSALFLMHRIREAMGPGEPGRLLTGVVEADEVYVGGRPRYKGRSKRGRGTKKTPVIGVVERGGEVRATVMERVTAPKLEAALAEQVDPNARLITDELNLYKRAGRNFKGGHDQIRHKDNEYVRPGTDIHTNAIEGFFSLLKRGVYGTFHSVSKKHLHRYLREFEFRYNNRRCDDGERTVRAIQSANLKRLTYKQAIS